MKNNRIFLAGGGTGGHAAPIFAIYNRLKKNISEDSITVIGAGTPEEKKFFTGLNYQKIWAGKFNRYFTLKNIIEFFTFLIGLTQAKVLLLLKRPTVIFSKGGYASLPITFMARFFNIPYYLHESDIVMGKVNFSLAKNAKKVFTTFPVEYYSKLSNITQSGPVLREAFLTKERDNIKHFGFKKEKPVLLITGGSQGALNLTNYFISSGKELLQKYNVIHQAGKHSIKEAKIFLSELSDEEKSSYYLTEFLDIEKENDVMHQALNLADLVVSRASSTATEASVMAKPMILVPWKYSAQDHQLKNARFFEGNNAAIIVQDDETIKRPLIDEVERLFENKNLMEEMGKNAKGLFSDNGTELICDQLLAEIGKK